MRAHEFLLERNYQQTSVMYHGTSDAFLRTILKQGLIIDSGNRSWTGGQEDSDAELPSLGGVYFTNKRRVAKMAALAAAEKHGGRPLMIVATVTHNFGYGDEDLPANTLFNTMWDKLKQHRNSYSTWIEKALASLGAGRFDKNIYDLVAEYFEVFENLIHQNPDLNPATAKDYNDKQLRERMLMKSQELKDVLAKISQAIRPRNTQGPDFPGDKIEKIQTGQTQSTFGHPNNQEVNVRITRNIGYSGKTRIILIYDLFSSKVYYQAPELGYKLDPRFFMNQKDGYESPNIYNTVPKEHDPRRGIITQNYWKSK